MPSDEAPVVVVSAHLESGPAPYEQRIKVGHHQVICDEAVSRGGGDLGPSPTALLVAALAACTSITLQMYAARKDWRLGAVKVEVLLVRAGGTDGADRIERAVHIEQPLAPEQRARLLEIAEKTPVTKTLKAGISILTRLA